MEGRVLHEFRNIAGPGGLITKEEELRVYECDGLTNFRVMPQAVVLPTTAKQVQEIVRVSTAKRFRSWRAARARG